MKKTISINLAGLVYQIDEDAYQLLENYLEKLKKTFTDPNEQIEILGDIEHRFAELFSEKLGKRTEVVNEIMVKEAIETLGEIELIEEEANANTSNANSRTNEKKLFRSTEDNVLAGVLGGLGAYFNIEPIWLRLAFVILAIASVGVPVGIIYIVLWLVMPKAITASQKLQMKGEAVNLNNIQENIKKNLSNENLSATGNQVARNFGDLLRTVIKFIVVLYGAMVGIFLLGFTFFWFLATFAFNINTPEYIALIFDSPLQFSIFSFSIYIILALPVIVLIFWSIKALRKQQISWGKNLLVSISTWFVALAVSFIIALTLFSNYKVEASAQNFVELPLTDSLQELKIDFVNELENEDFHFSYRKGMFKSGGFEINNKDILLNTVFLDIEPSDDGQYSLLAKKKSKGKNKEEAEAHLEKFFYEVAVKNGEILSLPMTLTLLNENKFRFQEMSYLLKIPVGTKLVFPDKAHCYIDELVLRGNRKQKSLDNNTWMMTSGGLECLTCPEESATDTTDYDKDEIEELIEDYIEKEIEEAFE